MTHQMISDRLASIQSTLHTLVEDLSLYDLEVGCAQRIHEALEDLRNLRLVLDQEIRALSYWQEKGEEASKKRKAIKSGEERKAPPLPSRIRTTTR